MSTAQDDSDDQSPSTTLIKLEHDSDDDLIGEIPSQLPSQEDDPTNRLVTGDVTTQPSASTYKGKIEVTSKGRRKIFDGVRWQILCRRPECRKQTNKKSLCITHYKEEFETNVRAASCSSHGSSVHLLSHHASSQPNNKRQTRSVIEDQNDTISTSNMIDTDEQYSLSIPSPTSIHEGQIRFLPNGRRVILKNSKWQPLCKFNHMCRRMAKYQLLCFKHFEIAHQKLRNPYTHRTTSASIEDSQHRDFAISSPSGIHTDYRISSSSVTDQFDIHSNDDNYEIDICPKTSTHSNRDVIISSPHHASSDAAASHSRSSTKLRSSQQNEQSVQTDLTIPVCCIIRQEAHSLVFSCIYDKSTSSMMSSAAKHEPQYYDSEY